jgi:hypothetical protein
VAGGLIDRDEVVGILPEIGLQRENPTNACWVMLSRKSFVNKSHSQRSHQMNVDPRFAKPQR